MTDMTGRTPDPLATLDVLIGRWLTAASGVAAVGLLVTGRWWPAFCTGLFAAACIAVGRVLVWANRRELGET